MRAAQTIGGEGAPVVSRELPSASVLEGTGCSVAPRGSRILLASPVAKLTVKEPTYREQILCRSLP